MEELAFEGVPLAAPPAASPAAPPAGPGPQDDGTPGSPASAPAVRLARQVQRAHAAVLDAHQAVIAWQLARASASGSSPAAAPPSAPPPDERTASAGPAAHSGAVREGSGPTAQEEPPGSGSADGGWVLSDELRAMVFAEYDDDAPPHALTGRQDTALLVRPSLPRGEMRMLDRIVSAEGAPGEYRPGSRGTTEYDVPQDPWYVRENGGAFPQLALMETALQPAGLFGMYLGVADEYPDQDLSCRNLEGRCRLLRPITPGAVTVEQHVTLRSHTALPGGVLQRYGFELHSDGEPFYTGEAVHGYLTPELLDKQQGLDGGDRVPPWLDRCPRPPADVRRLDLREDRRLGSGRLALLTDVALVPDGGDHGRGYLLGTKPVRPDDWFFEQHFFRDPVMPGSAGVQMLYQTVYAYALYTGLADHLPDPRCSVAVGEELSWSYRGQILREHQRVRGEVHIREARRDDGRVLVRADGSVWRDDLRIYEVNNIAVEIRPAEQRCTKDGR
ncbi:hypothetical protein AB0I22_21335 [Streptomyces sp. NPDC050610]|uniref:hypothetical protein n=1 Tax=Streptomyces sp. NPDC050610 TaxID=3157097 RepID=UPI00342EDD6B